MLELQDDKVEIDIRTLQAHLEQKKLFQEVGGLAYIATLEVDLPDLGRVEHYVEIVKERSLRRRLIAACSDIYRNCQDGGLEAKQALDRAEQAILELGEQATPRGFMTLGEAIKGTVFDLEERPDQLLTGIPSGFDDWDALSHGLNPGELIIIAGRPGMGKSRFSTNVAQSIALKHGKSVGIFSLEMSVQEIAMRILASEAEVPLRKRRPSDRDWDRIHRAARRIADARIFIDDSASPTLLEVSSKSRRLKLEKGLDLLIVDYLQLMQAGGRYENRNLEIGAITRGLKGLAKELSIPVIALSQLSRQPERRGSDHRSAVGGLRESGCLVGETLVPLADSGGSRPHPRADREEPTLRSGRSTSRPRRIEAAKVSKAFATGVKPVFALTTRLGRVIRATANHKFLSTCRLATIGQARSRPAALPYRARCRQSAR